MAGKEKKGRGDRMWRGQEEEVYVWRVGNWKKGRERDKETNTVGGKWTYLYSLLVTKGLKKRDEFKGDGVTITIIKGPVHSR